MNRKHFAVAVAALSTAMAAALGVLPSVVQAQSQAAEPAPFNDGRYIIKMRSQSATGSRVQAPAGSERERGRRAAVAAGGFVVKDLESERGLVALLSDDGVARIEQDPDV